MNFKQAGRLAYVSLVGLGVGSIAMVGGMDLYVRSDTQGLQERLEQRPFNRHTFCDINLPKELGSLTLLGEVHIYTQNESYTSEQILPNYDIVLNEGSGTPVSDRLNVIQQFSQIGLSMFFHYYALSSGSDWGNPTIERLALEKEMPVLYLEKFTHGGFDVVPHAEMNAFYNLGLVSFVTAPTAYYKGNEESQRYDPRIREINLDDTFAVHERNILMSDQIRRYMEEYGDARYLAVVGNAHFLEMSEMLGGCREQYFQFKSDVNEGD